MYTEKPEGEISLMEVQRLVKERMTILKALEQLKERFQFLSAQFKQEFEQVCAVQFEFTL